MSIENDSTYLSIDLDFWPNSESMLFWFDDHMHKIQNFHVTIVSSHERLLPDINSEKVSHVINMDYHSDLAEDVLVMDAHNSVRDRRLPNLDCGTWGNHIIWREDAKFTWIYPTKECVRKGFPGGYCHWYTNPFRKKFATTWKTVRKTTDLLKINWDNVVRIGIAISPDYLARCYSQYITEDCRGIATDMVRNFEDYIVPQLKKCSIKRDPNLEEIWID